MQKAAAGLVRELNVRHGTAIVVGTVIGSGIFLVPKEMMQAVGSPKLVYLAWITGGMLSLFGALTYAELGAMKPQAGGEYVYVRDAYGPLAGFLYAWTWFVIAKPASIAAITMGIVRVLGTFSALSILSTVAITAPFPITYGSLLAITLTLFISFLNYIGIRNAGEFQFFFTLLKISMVVAIIIVAFSYKLGAADNFGGHFPTGNSAFGGFMIALVAALWAYDGWNDLNLVAGEVENPGRNIPISLIAGMLIVAVLYMGLNAAVQFVLPATALAISDRPASDAMQLAAGAVGRTIVSAGMALSMLVTLNGTIMSGARVPFAVSRDGYFFNALSRVNPKFHTPSISIAFQAVLAIILLLVGGKFQQLFALAIFAEWLFYMIASSTIFVFRRREPNTARPYRAWGYPIVPALFLIAAGFLLVYTFKQNLRNSLLGSVVILAGVPVFFCFSWFRSKNQNLDTYTEGSEG